MTDTTSKWISAKPLPLFVNGTVANGTVANGTTLPRAIVDEIDVEPEVTDEVEAEPEREAEADADIEFIAEIEVDLDVSESPPFDGESERETETPSPAEPIRTAKPPTKARSVLRGGIRIFALTIVAFVVFALLLSGLAEGRSQVGLQRRFRAQLASNAAPVGGAIPTGSPVAVIEIRAIGLHEAVVEGSRSSQLRNGPGHVLGTPLPGQPGNAVIAGRRTMYGGPFGRLGSLHPGNRIHITTGEGNTTYRVASVHTLGVKDGSFVQDHRDNRLTLFTTDSRWAANGRLVVTATLLGNPLPPTTLQRTLDADGLGLTGERDSAPNVLVWLELLAGAALLATFARSRWSTPRVWLVFAPAIALLVWLFFESAVRLLPATL